MKRVLTIAVIVLFATAVPRAQQPVGSPMQGFSYPSGWVFTPEMGFGETYDDNIGLFGETSGATRSDDFVQMWQPGADLHYAGRHTEFGLGYSGSFLNYQTFSTMNFRAFGSVPPSAMIARYAGCSDAAEGAAWNRVAARHSSASAWKNAARRDCRCWWSRSASRTASRAMRTSCSTRARCRIHIGTRRCAP